MIGRTRLDLTLNLRAVPGVCAAHSSEAAGRTESRIFSRQCSTVNSLQCFLVLILCFLRTWHHSWCNNAGWCFRIDWIRPRFLIFACFTWSWIPHLSFGNWYLLYTLQDPLKRCRLHRRSEIQKRNTATMRMRRLMNVDGGLTYGQFIAYWLISILFFRKKRQETLTTIWRLLNILSLIRVIIF